ncbi:ribonuclease H-like domain-containing protein [Tanacetum coccineum]
MGTHDKTTNVSTPTIALTSTLPVAYQATGPSGLNYFTPPAPFYGSAPYVVPAQSFGPSVPLGSRSCSLEYGYSHTGASSHLNNSVNSLSEIFNTCMYPSISVGDAHSIPVTNTGHSILPTPLKSLHLNNVLITPHIVKILIFVRDNNCTIEFDAFGFSVKDFMTRQVLFRCDSTGDLYPVTASSPIPHVFFVSQHTWHQRLGHPGGEVLRRLVSSNFISCNKEKSLVLCHACQLGKHVRLPFGSSCIVISSCFDIIHSDVWTSLIPSLSDLVTTFIASLHQEFSMTDLGSLNYFLGISVTRDSSGMFLSQKKYDVEILERAYMINCNPSRTLIDTESKLGRYG